LAFDFPIKNWFGAEKPATTDEQNHANESFRKWLLSSVWPHPDVIRQLTIPQEGVEHLDCQRSEQEPANGKRIASALGRNTSMKDLAQLVGGEIEDEC
jgi:hypothetical protein